MLLYLTNQREEEDSPRFNTISHDSEEDRKWYESETWDALGGIFDDLKFKAFNDNNHVSTRLNASILS